ncbi:MAG: hypothetical protein AUJ92_17895 [Armatimonadetes bacterium CG2_30_59_28]|nr:MAG: hypothetical protein AUJ92_17895 [Armatimonadetes bacterium CG2_30_59_28]PIU67538.1 MAG: hypothetical protein COS85_00505 [Armatimonadetes bacterium CG07_land_8_20_14_0_80_59_28]
MRTIVTILQGAISIPDMLEEENLGSSRRPYPIVTLRGSTRLAAVACRRRTEGECLRYIGGIGK